MDSSIYWESELNFLVNKFSENWVYHFVLSRERGLFQIILKNEPIQKYWELKNKRNWTDNE